MVYLAREYVLFVMIQKSFTCSCMQVSGTFEHGQVPRHRITCCSCCCSGRSVHVCACMYVNAREFVRAGVQ